jgi:hypothetical protein
MKQFSGYGNLDWVTRNKFLSRLTVMTSIQTNPNYSVSHLILIKLRVLIEYSIRTIYSLRFNRKALRSLKKLAGSRSKVKAIVLGNGPSVSTLLSDTNIPSLENFDIFVVNFFPLSELGSTVLPKAIVLSDPLTHPLSKSEKNRQLWNWIHSQSNLEIFVPSSWFNHMEQSEFASRCVYFDDRSLVGWTKNISPIKARGYGSLTSYKALAIAYFLGYKKIGILGFDNSMFRAAYTNMQNRVFQGSNYFYDEKADLDITDSLNIGISDYFYDTANSFAYLRFFGKLNVYNLDSHSLVDVIEKIPDLRDF